MSNTVFYSDAVNVSYNSNGFVLNFMTGARTDDTGAVVEEGVDYGFRIGLSPQAAKMTLYVLLQMIAEYEEKNGAVSVDNSVVQKVRGENKMPAGFRLDDADASDDTKKDEE